MEIQFDGGRFVSYEGELNYKKVLEDFSHAKTIRIVTYNISKNQRLDKLIDALKHTSADIQLITNVPSRMPEYYNTNAGQHMRNAAHANIQIYVAKLNPESFQGQFVPFFNVKNHAKIIGTENIVYIGSANYSNESANNIETGVLIEDKQFIQQLYFDFFDKIKNQSLSYYDEEFSAFRLFVLSLQAKFHHHHRKILSDLYTDYGLTKQIVADTVFLDRNDLVTMYVDLDELESVCNAADSVYDDDSDDYNDELEKLKMQFERLSIDWLKSVISEDGSLYDLVSYNFDGTVHDILQEEYSTEVLDENLDYYVEKSSIQAQEIYRSRYEAFLEEADGFLAQFEKILSALDAAVSFTRKWHASKINPRIDNT